MAELIILICMAVLLLSWVILCAVWFAGTSTKIMAESDFVAHVKCEECGQEYDVQPEEFAKRKFVKSVSTTKTELKGAALVNQPKFRYYAKKFQCPFCGKKKYAQVLNLDEITEKFQSRIIRFSMKVFLVMILGGVIILLLTKIPLAVNDKIVEKRVEQMREEMYSE